MLCTTITGLNSNSNTDVLVNSTNDISWGGESYIFENDDTTELSFEDNLKKLRQKNLNRIIIAHININSVRNKFELIKDSIKDNIDIFMISETKRDDSFPLGQFLIEGFTLYRRDRDRKGGGIMFFVREDIPSKIVFN